MPASRSYEVAVPEHASAAGASSQTAARLDPRLDFPAPRAHVRAMLEIERHLLTFCRVRSIADT